MEIYTDDLVFQSELFRISLLKKKILSVWQSQQQICNRNLPKTQCHREYTTVRSFNSIGYVKVVQT